ncbi:hypothetical protein MGA5115_02230 [Marinomonas gallaica]|uniref:Relaxase/mobilization nuclease domain protein n=1 Tax=Marinomonas gallaica TaxID=1806667 RepID=A0A1C3JST9_9GAMM|nr:hypothetical protein [Marinomonas gallaica]SBT18110.1 hypothetical protein MGA5115_02230 [Marinomonas gallaica]SBT22490.1 hypothetical protein MGA5116_03112 [Marinomonas gallaica]
MTIFSLKHEATTIKQLKKVIKYNSNDKAGLNNTNNPRLISVSSNCGYCSNVNDENEYNQLVDNFILSVDANSQLSKNSRQKYLYEHSVISFSNDDDERLGMANALKLAIKTAKKYDPNFEKTPYMIWPQVDSGKLHFHLVRGYHDESGNYHRQSNSGLKRQAAVQKIEKEHKLSLTGKNNPENYIWKIDVNNKKKKIYVPNLSDDNKKIVKNKSIDYDCKIDELGDIKYSLKKKENKIISDINKNKDIHSNNRKIVNNKINTIYGEITELEKPIKYGFFQKAINWFTDQVKVDNEYKESLINENKNKITKLQDIKTNDWNKKNNHHRKLNGKKIINEKEINVVNNKEKIILDKKDDLLNDNDFFSKLKNTVNNAYRNSKTTQEFIEILNDNKIEIFLNMRENGTGGITFTSLNDDVSLAGGKINSYLTYGKIKKNDADLFDYLNNRVFKNDSKLSIDNDFDVKNLNYNYKQIINIDGSMSIFYNKKDEEKRPNNYNLKISGDKKTISLSPNSNTYDLELTYKIAKENGWKNAVSSNKELVLNSMKTAFKNNKDDLFFFKLENSSISLDDIKSVVSNEKLSNSNLIDLYDNKLTNNDIKEQRDFIISKLDKRYDADYVKQELNKDRSLKSIFNDKDDLYILKVDHKNDLNKNENSNKRRYKI